MTEPPANEPPQESSPYSTPGSPGNPTPPGGYGAAPADAGSAPADAGSAPAGYAAPPGYAPGQYATRPRNGMGTAALVIGIVAVLGILTVVLGILLGLLALIFGIIGRKRATRREATNGGAALAGAILGAIALVVSGVLIALGAVFFVNHKSDIEKLRDCLRDAQTSQQDQVCRDNFSNDISN